ncbi:hypothetical protein EMIHUDRAFT_242540 [Emiliania huxleyi CCMP1516]|uniref:RING-type domain-containing protein n=2 Tax=Emiliania huxleyi TaxID=2903 RepID=A0A0D3J8L3_EMIH1|nr:hypothetical protein EMIHUDRAFT_242540 [Emiliania huxleyi CCMP1516]EOD19848.1 hypothetical protein EMIHUDRAFT_242540 [Emiliania huxleyi CCMP1516]|eukprot:XP_005772277.1 hypothetical protein EMIHUDRAFT_242540 [Emiliania huxleyi CCMP1516]
MVVRFVCDKSIPKARAVLTEATGGSLKYNLTEEIRLLYFEQRAKTYIEEDFAPDAFAYDNVEGTRQASGSHLECCPGGVAAAPPFAAAAAASQNSAASSVASEVACPSCGSYFPTEAAVFAHLDPPTQLAPKSIEALAAELRCTVCMDIFDEPTFLPCGHNFCLACITDCFRIMSQMCCPLCKAPTWRRQVTANHSLASIVAAYRAIADAHQS